MAQLYHPNVVTVFDVGTHQDSVFIAMEYVEGRTLREWLKQKKPAQKDVLDILKAAGRGLVAAHKQGIVHRDFKPGNVIIGEDGRVRVLDFGLAHSTTPEGKKTAMEESGEYSSSSSDSGDKPMPDLAASLGSGESIPSRELMAKQALATSLDPERSLSESGSAPTGDLLKGLLLSSLTRTGTLMGTPYYMSPEQHRRQPTDELSDQFSFCVVLHEALYGKLPFAGTRYLEFARNVVKGRLQPTPTDANVPGWISRVLQRGLQAKPDKRYDSMQVLLEELDHDPAAARTRRLTIASFLTLALLAAFGIWDGVTRDSRRCQGAETRLDGIWDSDVEQRVRTAFGKTGRPYAAGTFQRVKKHLDLRRDAWVGMWTEACEATHIHGSQSGKMLDLRMHCLDRKLIEFNALTELFSHHADGRVVDKAVHATLALSTLDRCADKEALSAAFPPPEDPEIRARVQKLQKELEDVRALTTSGKVPEGFELAQKVLKRAEATDFKPLIAESMYAFSELNTKLGHYQEAEKLFRKTLVLGAEARHDEVVAKAAKEFLYLTGYKLGRYEAGLQSYPLVEGALVRGGNDPKLRARTISVVGILLERLGRYQESVQHEKQALALRTEALGAEHPATASSLNNLGIVYERIGEYEESLRYHRRALAIREKALGDRHISVAESLNNLGIVLQRNGDLDESQKVLERADALWAAALGEEIPVRAHAMNNLGNVFNAKGQWDKAMEQYGKALGIWEKSAGMNHSNLAHPLTGMGQCSLALGNISAARKYLERALAIRQSKAGDPNFLGETQLALAKVLWRADKEKQRAAGLAGKARQTFSQAKGKYWHQKLVETDEWLLDNNISL